MEEDLFACRRDLLTTLDIVFMDTTSLYFEGAGGQTLGRRGFSKDHRPDLNQMVLAVLLDGDGRPVCTEMWPGNTADVGSQIPAIKAPAAALQINRVCVAADGGTISADDRRARGATAALCAGRARANRQAGAANSSSTIPRRSFLRPEEGKAQRSTTRPRR